MTSTNSTFDNPQPIWVKLSLIQSKSTIDSSTTTNTENSNGASTNPNRRSFSSRSLTSSPTNTSSLNGNASSSSSSTNRSANGWGWLFGYVISTESTTTSNDRIDSSLANSRSSPYGSPRSSSSSSSTCPSPPQPMSSPPEEEIGTTTLRSSPFGQVKLRKTPRSNQLHSKSIHGNNTSSLHSTKSNTIKNDEDNHNKLESSKTIRIHDDWNTIYNNQEFNLTPQEVTNNVVLANTFLPILQSNSSNLQSNHNEPKQLQIPKNLIELTHLHEPSLIKSLKERYDQGLVYTLCGKILLALNPFCEIQGLYGKSAMKRYWNYGNETGDLNIQQQHDDDDDDGRQDTNDEKNIDRTKSLEPHVYAIAHEAYTAMRRAFDDLENLHSNNGKRGRNNHNSTTTDDELQIDQSILVSGESGAGKTVTTKIVMQYLASLSEKSNGHSVVKTKDNTSTANKGNETRTMEQQVLQSNPILESFGNARTIRNDNSSRFGKFIEIQFHKSGCLMGASINTYLLEKVRLIRQAQGERNYHIFYEMLAGLDRRERRELGLGQLNVHDFRITSCSGTLDRRDGVQDKDTFQALMHAMKTVGFSNDEQREILQVTSGLLHMSNLDFLETKMDTVVIDEGLSSLQHVLNNFGVTFDLLSNALCTCTITVGQEIVKKNLSLDKVEKAMEALMKATYGALFDYIVKRVNNSITVGNVDHSGNNQASKSTQDYAFIKILDIFGFESFEKNSFEQLCINYCNEALQQQFNRFIFKLEQQEYEKENIAWSFISFPDNQDVLDLIEKKHSGIFSILDEQCKLAKCTDSSFSRALYEKCEEHNCFESSRTQKARGLFAVRHYAGTVEYDTSSFLNKNKDELPKEATDFLLSSSISTVRKLGEILSYSSNHDNNGSNGRKFNNAKSALSKASVGNQFTAQLRELRCRIELTSPHYIRCMKPNDELTPDNFVPAVIANQLNCAGVLEAVRVSRVGYPQRYTKDLFVRRYWILCITAMERAKRRRGDLCDELVESLVPRVWSEQQGYADEPDDQQSSVRSSYDLISVGIQLGKTKVFLRHHAFNALERLRGKKQQYSACKLQSIFRMLYFKRQFQKMCSSTIILQCAFRVYKARRKLQFLRESNYATVLQSAWRGYVKYTKYSYILFLTSWCQRRYRGNVARTQVKVLLSHKQALVIQSWWRREIARKRFNAIQLVARNIQLLYRSKQARAVLRRMKMEARDVSKISVERDKLKEQIASMKEKEQQMMQTIAETKIATEISQNEKLERISSESKQKDEEIVALKDALKKSENSLEINKKYEADQEISSLMAQLRERDSEIERLNTKIKDLQKIIMQYENQSLPSTHTTSRFTSPSSLLDSKRKLITPNTIPNDLNESWSQESTSIRPKALNFDTPIHTAIRAADSDALSQAITNCDDISDINRRGHDSKSPLHLAVLNSNLESAKFLLQNQSVANTQDDDGNTPLHYAEDSSMVKLLLETGKANPNIPNESGICAIHVAVRKRDVESVKLMIEHGANVNAADDRKWLTPLHLIAQPYYSEKPGQSGCDVNQRTMSIAKLLLEAKFPDTADVDYQDKEGNTPLHHCAVLSSRYAGDLISLLLKMTASSNIQNNRGQTVLHLVLHNMNLRKFEFYHDLVQLIIYHGSATDVSSLSGCTPLHLALYHQDTKNAVQLIENGAQLHRPWDKPVRWQAHWQEFSIGPQVYAMEMIDDDETRVSLISSIKSKQNFAPIRSNCMHCKKKIGAFARPKNCEHCGSMICNSCAPNVMDKTFFPSYCELQQTEGRVCLICESLLIARKRDANIMGREVYAIHGRLEDVSFLDMDASHQESDTSPQLQVEM